jgi:flagellar motor switch protein FliN/FliY
MLAETSCLDRIDAFADVSAHLEARIGQCVMSLDQLASLNVGSTIQLDRNAGDTLELRVGNVVIGSCEVVVIEDRLAIRIVELAL